MEVSVQLYVPAALPPGKKTPVPTGQEAEWAHKRSGGSEVKKMKNLNLQELIDKVKLSLCFL
jgi:hypothetical protein